MSYVLHRRYRFITQGMALLILVMELDARLLNRNPTIPQEWEWDSNNKKTPELFYGFVKSNKSFRYFFI
jgi:hypothetical protein